MQSARQSLTVPTLSAAQRLWLSAGLSQAGGKLPLYNAQGLAIADDIRESCIAAGWAEPWVLNPHQGAARVCRLSDAGRTLLLQQRPIKPEVIKVDFSQWRRG